MSCSFTLHNHLILTIHAWWGTSRIARGKPHARASCSLWRACAPLIGVTICGDSMHTLNIDLPFTNVPYPHATTVPLFFS